LWSTRIVVVVVSAPVTMDDAAVVVRGTYNI